MKPITTKRTVNASAVDNDTGELLDIPVIETVQTDSMLISSSDYMIIDSNGWNFIRTILTNGEVAKVIDMGDCLKTGFNIIFNNTIPHTKKTLSDKFGIDEVTFRRLIHKLVKCNIMAYSVCSPSGYMQKVYMLNPTVIRKRKVFDKTLSVIFRDFGKTAQL